MATDRMNAMLLGVALLLATASQAQAQAPGKPAAVTKGATPTHGWHDGNARRTLYLETGLRADFSPTLSGKAMAMRQADEALKGVSPSLQSPVFRDESGRLRALPGGVMVVTRDALGESEARALLVSHDARLTRRIGERTWLVESAAGLASLDLANRLAATGAFAAAQPNWWVERALK